MLRRVSYRVLMTVVTLLLCVAMVAGQEDTLHNADGSYETGLLKDGFKDGYWMSYYPDGCVRSEGNFEEGVRVGQWIWYHANGKTKGIEKWKNGMYAKGAYWDDEGSKSDISEVLSSPEYPGGMEAFKQMIASNLRYPESVQLEGVEGCVVLQFQICANGELIRPQVTKNAHPQLDEEALRVIQLSDAWIPGEFHGRKTTTRYTFPITFALQD